MTAPYFTHSDRALENTLITSTQWNDNLDSVEASFDLLSDPDTILNGIIDYQVATNSDNDLTILIPGILIYADGYTVRFSSPLTITGVARLQINGLGFIIVKRDDLSSTQVGDFVKGSIYELSYGVTAGAFIMQSAPAGIVTQTQVIYDDFDEKYLGASALAPSLDNQGNTIQEGAMYFSTSSNVMWVRTVGVWTPINTYVKEWSDTPPLSPYAGQEWFDTSAGVDYTYLDNEWVQQTLFADGSEVVTIITSNTLSTASVTATATLDLEVSVQFVDASSGALVATLPTAVGILGASTNMKRVDTSSNLITIITTGAETIDTFTELFLATDQNITVVSDGTNWRIV